MISMKIEKRVIKSISIILTTISLCLLPNISKAGFFNKIIKEVKSIVDPSNNNFFINYLGINTITKVPYIKDTTNFVKNIADSAVKSGSASTVNYLNSGITEITNQVQDAKIIKNLDSGLTTFISTINTMDIPQLLGALPINDAQAWGEMALNVINGFTDCLSNAANTASNNAAQGTAEGLTCFSQAATMMKAMIENIIAIRKVIRYIRQIANGKHNDDLTEILTLLDDRSALNAIKLVRRFKIKFNMNNSLSNDENKQLFFGQFSTIDEIRNSSSFDNGSSNSYIASLSSACENIALPGLCDDADKATQFNRFNMQEFGLSDTELQTRKAQFTLLMQHSFGQAFDTIYSTIDTDTIIEQLNRAMYQTDPLNDGIDRRIPYLVSNKLLDGGPGAFIYNDNDGIILLNENLFNMQGLEEEEKSQIVEVYVEELGHYLNFMRCKLNNIYMENCDVIGDAGARFQEAALLDTEDLNSALNTLNQYDSNNPKVFSLGNDGGDLHYETFPSITDMQTALAKKNISFRWRLRAQVAFKSKLVGSGVDSKAMLELRYYPPQWLPANTYDPKNTCTSCVVAVGKLQVRLADQVYTKSGASTSDTGEERMIVGQAGLSRGHSIIFPMVVKERSNGRNVFDTKIMKQYAQYKFDQSLYANAYVKMFGSIIPTAVGTNFDSLMLTGKAGPNTTWPLHRSKDIAAGMGVGALMASIGCGVGGYLGSYMGEQIDGCVAGSQVGEAMGVFTYGALSKVATSYATAGVRIGIRMKSDSFFSDAITSAVKATGYQAETLWDSSGAFSVEIRNELNYTAAKWTP